MGMLKLLIYPDNACCTTFLPMLYFSICTLTVDNLFFCDLWIC